MPLMQSEIDISQQIFYENKVIRQTELLKKSSGKVLKKSYKLWCYLNL